MAWRAAKAAFPSHSHISREDRLALLERVVAAYKVRYEDVAQTLSREMGAPFALARNAQAAISVGHLTQMIATLRDYHFDEILRRHAHHQGADRRMRADHALELAHQPEKAQI